MSFVAEALVIFGYNVPMRHVGQAHLFPGHQLDAGYQENLALQGVDVDEVDVGDITFRPGQAEPVHRWYRLTPSYAPSLVRYLLAELEVDDSDVVYDPFSGRGTTVIECQRRGLDAVGGEINPVLQQAGDRSLRWEPSCLPALSEFLEEVRADLRAAGDRPLDEFLARDEVALPDIHDVFRWWQKPVLRDLLLAKRSAERTGDDAARNYAWLALNAACLDCANIHRNHPTITFDDDHGRDINVLAEIERRVRQITEDLEAMPPEEVGRGGTCRIAACDARRDPRETFGADFSPTVVICSPPYPNRFSYVHQTRPQLHFMSLVDRRSAATDIDLQSVGGTWGRATSDLMKADLAVLPELADAFDFHPMLREKSRLMANYAVKYFTDLYQHLRALRAVAPASFRAAYVVGNSRLSGVEIYTEAVLSELCRRAGFEVERVLVFRKRGGRKRLYESAVIFRCGPGRAR